MSWKSKCLSGLAMVLMLLFATLVSADKPPVLTFHNDPASTGQNLQETALNLMTVKSGTFGKLFTVPVDGQIYAQPLYVPAIAIKGRRAPGDPRRRLRGHRARQCDRDRRLDRGRTLDPELHQTAERDHGPVH